ncbi:MAG: protein kinase [Polyangiaceae bacterium]|nr:protein kinase [Polyangiaceae bacterium]
MGEVFAVEHLALGERRVMKLLQGEYAHDEEAHPAAPRRGEAAHAALPQAPRPRPRFRLHLGAAARTWSPSCSTARTCARVRRTGPLDVDLALRLTSQVLAGLEVVHAAELVHRDLKPDNLFIARDGDAEVAKILDFGIAKILREETRREIGHVKPTADGVMMGTPQYISPEQISGEVGRFRTDIYGRRRDDDLHVDGRGPVPSLERARGVARAHGRASAAAQQEAP